MELFIIIGVIFVIGFVINIFNKYKEGREAVIDLRKTSSELFVVQRRVEKGAGGIRNT